MTLTDHPSNPPSQTKGQEIGHKVAKMTHRHPEECRTRNGATCPLARHTAELVDSALAAQEARHKAEMEKVEQERDAAWAVVDIAETAAGLEGTRTICGFVEDVKEERILQVQIKKRLLARAEEAESKLREATEREKVLVEASRNLLDVLRVESRIRSGFPPDNVAIATARGSLLAAIRSGPAQQAADTPHVKDHAFVDPGGEFADGEKSDSCQHITRSRFGERVCHLGRADHVADPPEQETPKPRKHASYCMCLVCSAPPAHGGGD